MIHVFFLVCTATGPATTTYSATDISQAEMVVKINTWKSKYRVRNFAATDINGKCLVTPTLIRKPDDELLARDLNLDHVATLCKSFLLCGCADVKVDGLIWEFDGKTCDDVVNDTDFPLDIQAMVGLHSSTSIIELNAGYPDNIDFAKTPCVLYMCPNTAENRQLAHAWGNLQNKLAQTQLPMTAIDYMKQCRTSYVTVNNRYPSSNKISQASKKKEMSASIKNLAASWNIPVPSVQQYWGICNRSEQIWQLVTKIFHGEVQHNKMYRFVKPVSLTHFVQMGKIPDDKLVKWLSAIVAQNVMCRTTKHFLQRCVRYKKTVIVQQLMLNFMSAAFGIDYNNFDEFDEKNDWLTPDWFNDQVDVCPEKIKVNAGLPQSVKVAITKRVESAKEQQQVLFVLC